MNVFPCLNTFCTSVFVGLSLTPLFCLFIKHIRILTFYTQVLAVFESVYGDGRLMEQEKRRRGDKKC